MRVVIRADASRVIGSGHVMRTLTLAQSLRAAGVEVCFICRRHAGNLIQAVEARGFAVMQLAAPPHGPSPPRQGSAAAWLGVAWEDDARDTAAAIQALAAETDWLVVDHYGIDGQWETALRPHVRHLLVIDDLADRTHDCDLLLDQNLVVGFEQRYTGRLPQRCATMLGPRYALLQPLYEELHDRILPRSGPVRRLCIYFGAADLHDLTARAVHAFLALQRADIEADVIVSTGTAASEALRARVQDHPNVHLYAALPSLAPLLAQADLGIGAAGSTSWERMCLGLPALVVSLADNQQAVAAELHRRGFITWLGSADQVRGQDLQRALAAQIERGADTASSEAGRAAVDGRGVRRVRAALLARADMPLVVRHAVAADEALLLEWANDPDTRRNSYARKLISAAEHHEWLRARLEQPERCQLLIIQSQDDVPLGTVRFDKVGDGCVINYSIAAPYRRRGLARPMLELAMARLAGSGIRRVTGRVMRANTASHRVFARLGFRPVSDADGVVEYQRAL